MIETDKLYKERDAHLAALCAIADALYIDTVSVSPGIDRYRTDLDDDEANTIAHIVNGQIPGGLPLDIARGGELFPREITQ